MVITVYLNRSFSFVTKTSGGPAAQGGWHSRFGEPNKNKVGKVTQAQIRRCGTEKAPT